METNKDVFKEKYKEIANSLINIDQVDRVFGQDETKQLLKIFNRRTSVDYDSSRVKLIKQTESISEYDIHFYKDGVKLKEQRLVDITSMDKPTFINKFITKYFPELERKPKVKKSRKKKPFEPSEYVINFGKHTGRKIIYLTSPEEIQYCEWCVKQFRKSPKISKKLKAFEWHLEQMKKGA